MHGWCKMDHTENTIALAFIYMPIDPKKKNFFFKEHGSIELILVLACSSFMILYIRDVSENKSEQNANNIFCQG